MPTLEQAQVSEVLAGRVTPRNEVKCKNVSEKAFLGESVELNGAKRRYGFPWRVVNTSKDWSGIGDRGEGGQ
jgi:hypothetical protein